MSRTPLLNSVRQFMSEIRAERGLGSSVGAENQGGVNRRDFMLGAAAMAAASLMPKAAWAGSAAPSIVIIGAGIAGLNCALTLADHHVAATIYEASHRAGGRMFSHRDTWDDGQVSEWCGELIDTGHKTVRSLAKRFDLPLDDLLAAQPQASEDTNYFAEHYYSQSQARADFFALADVVDADLTAAGYPTRFDAYTDAGYMLDNMSVYDWIESRIPGGHNSQLGKLLDVAYNVEYGAETTEQSALNLLYLLGFQSNPKSFGVFGESDERFHIRGGNDRLPSAIADHLGQDRFRFGHKLTRISQNGKGGYHLVFNTQSGIQNVSCDILVLALPFSVLRDIDYTEAGFDARKHMAIQQLGRGRNGKLQLQFNQRVWNQIDAWPGKSSGSSYSDSGYQASWDVTRAQEGVSLLVAGFP